jgi:hypothetical protein
VTTTVPGMQLALEGQPRLAAGAWIRPGRMPRLPHRSPAGQCATAARVRPGVSTEPIEDSTARLIARASAVSTGSELPGVFSRAACPGRSLRPRRPAASAI